jgi:hypothetical protein
MQAKLNRLNGTHGLRAFTFLCWISPPKQAGHLRRNTLAHLLVSTACTSSVDVAGCPPTLSSTSQPRCHLRISCTKAAPKLHCVICSFFARVKIQLFSLFNQAFYRVFNSCSKATIWQETIRNEADPQQSVPVTSEYNMNCEFYQISKYKFTHF